MTTPRPTGTLADPPGGCGPAWERPGARPAAKKLALFDLDHTLLSGDSDALWCEFLMQQGVLDRAVFEPRNADMAWRYGDASVSVQDFCDFYVGTGQQRFRVIGIRIIQWTVIAALGFFAVLILERLAMIV